jgi:hypothetical protein
MKSKQYFAPFIILGLLISVTLPISTALAQTQVTNCNRVKIASWDGCPPEISTSGVVSTDQYSAIVKATYTSNGANYNVVDQPHLFIEYGLYSNGNFDMTSDTHAQTKGSRTDSFLLNGLREGQRYYYHAVLTWPGGRIEGETKVLTATKQTLGTGSSPATTNTGTTTGTQTTTVIGDTSPGPIFGGGLFGTKKTTTTTTSTSQFKNLEEKNGFRLAIDDGVTKVAQGEQVNLKVRYENNNTKSATGAVVKVYLAPQFTFVSTTKGIYDRVDNMVTIDLRDFTAGGFGTVIITANATGKPGDLDQAISQATLSVSGNTLKVMDIDEYSDQAGKTKSGNVLGASATGSGFLPSSIVGWVLLLVVLAIIVIVGRRYFVKKDY